MMTITFNSNIKEKNKILLNFDYKNLNDYINSETPYIEYDCDISDICEFVKDEEIKSITSIKDFLLSLGLLGPYLDSYNYNSKKLGFEDLDYEFSSSDNSIGLVDSLSKEYLETLSIAKLWILV